MAYRSEDLVLFFQHIFAKRISEANTMANTFFWGLGRIGQGRRAALEGIISLLNVRSTNPPDYGLQKVTEMFSRRMNTIWCDEFDKSYFDVWIKFYDFISKRNIKETS